MFSYFVPLVSLSTATGLRSIESESDITDHKPGTFGFIQLRGDNFRGISYLSRISSEWTLLRTISISALTSITKINILEHVENEVPSSAELSFLGQYSYDKPRLYEPIVRRSLQE